MAEGADRSLDEMNRVVAVAGCDGLAPFETFLRSLGTVPTLITVAVCRLDTSARGALVERLTEAGITCESVHGDLSLRPGRLYVASTETAWAVRDLQLVATDGEPARAADILLDSVAHLGEDAIGVLLGPSEACGAFGARSIKSEGGVVICAPKAGEGTGGLTDRLLDWVGAPEAAARRVLSVLSIDRTERGLSPSEGLGHIFDMLLAATGHDFIHYKHQTIMRRVERRIGLGQHHDLETYLTVLKEQPEELADLYRDLLIGVTRFFRDPAAFEALRGEVLDRLADRNEAGNATIRVWVAGCSTGQEAYSVAIALAEALRAHGRTTPVQIFATDIDEESLDIARIGLYSDEAVATMPRPLLARYFRRAGKGWQPTKAIRSMVIFCPHNLTRDPPFSKLDLVCCRNVLIYFSKALQNRLMPMFHYALKPGGYLFLGPSESPAGFMDLFRIVDKRAKLFAAKLNLRRRPSVFNVVRDRPAASTVDGRKIDDPAQIAQQLLMAEHAPPGVVINDRQHILHFLGRSARFLEPPMGAPDLNVLQMAKRGLRLPLRAIIHRANKDAVTEAHETVDLELDGAPARVRITARAIHRDTVDAGLTLIVFEDLPVNGRQHLTADHSLDARVKALGAELTQTKDTLETTIEELETSNEEMRSSNHELLAMNEEMQSTNEELETSKEELQSVNEELQTVNEELETVNSELKRKLVELGRANDDMKNLLASTRIATIFLDGALNITRLTPSVAELFQLDDADLGRHISLLEHRLIELDLCALIEQVMRELVPISTRVRVGADSTFQLRVLPYRSTGNIISGVVLTFVDVTREATAERTIRASERKYRGLFDSIRDGLVLVRLDGTIERVNEAYARLVGASVEVLAGTLFAMRVHEAERDSARRMIEGALGDAGDEIELRFVSLSGRRSPCQCRVWTWGEGAERRVIVLARDLSVQRELESRLRQSRKMEALGQLVGGIAHNFNNMLQAMLPNIELAMEGEPDEQVELLEDALMAGRQAGSVVRQLMRFSQRQRLERAPVDLRAVCRVVRDMCVHTFSRHITVSLNVSERPIWTLADAGQLQQLLLNLCLNARDAAVEAPSPHIEITLDIIALTPDDRSRHPDAPYGAFARFQVRDNGRGMDATTLERAFDPFFTTKRQGAEKRVGLGLSTAYGIARDHQGWLDATTAAGVGSTFSILLPVVDVDAAQHRVQHADRVGRGSERLLLVDDEEIVRRVHLRVFETAGFEVTEAADGTEALALLNAETQLMILDLSMPGLSGREVLKRALARYPSLKVVVLTGYLEDRIEGASAVLNKPIGLDRLLQITREVLDTE